MIESLRVDQWLFQILSNDSILRNFVNDRIYGYLAPQKSDLPFIIFSKQSGVDIRGVGPSRIMSDLLYQVKVVDYGRSPQKSKNIGDRLDVLLQGASGTLNDGTILMCVREQIIEYIEFVDGIPLHHLGGLWRIFVR